MEQESQIVERGVPGGPVVILLDPVGFAARRLPEPWAMLAEYVRLVCFGGFAQDDPLVEARILLDREARASREVYLVTSPEGGQIASLLAGHQPDVVRGVFMVHSSADVVHPSGIQPRTSPELWTFLRGRGIFARSVVPNVDGVCSGLERPEAVEAISREVAGAGAVLRRPTM